MKRPPEFIRIVYPAMSPTVGITLVHLPRNASGVHHCPVDDWTRDIPEHPDCELDKAQRHGFVPRLHATECEQHGTHLTRRMKQHDEHEDDKVNGEIRTGY
jgi:transposase